MKEKISSKSIPTIHSIQYLRALAALMVVAHHALRNISIYKSSFGFFKIGAAGVDLFFIISGFVMWLTTSGRNVNIFDFMLKRFIRVAPLYWLIIISMLVASMLTSTMFQNYFEMPEVIYSLLFIPHYHFAYPDKIYPILTVGWTLNYEMFFYFIFGALLFLPRYRLVLLPVSLSILVLLGSLFESDNALIKTYTNNLLLEFVIGVFIAKLFLDGRLSAKPMSLSLLLCLLGLVSLFATNSINLENLTRFFYWGIPSALIVVAALMFENSRVLPRLNIMHLLGDASYSIYLSHLFILPIVRKLWLKVIIVQPTIDQIISYVLLCILISSIIGIIIHKLIEKPMTKYLRESIIRKKTPDKC
jgi:exopolysaccharide production protein ExoZ